MNKVFTSAKIAGICYPFIMVLQLVLVATKNNGAWATLLSSILVCGLWIVFLSLLISASNKKSPVVTPSWIVIIGFILAFISGCFASYASHLVMNESDNWHTIGQLYSVSGIIHDIDAVIIAIGLIWLSKYFEKGSTLKAMAIMIAIVTVLIPVLNLTVKPWNISDEDTRMTVTLIYSAVRILLIYIPPTIFFFSFAKLKKA